MSETTFSAAVALIVLMASNPLRAQEAEPALLLGEWELESVDGAELPSPVTMTLQEDGTLVVRDERGSWRLDTSSGVPIFRMQAPSGEVTDLELRIQSFHLVGPDGATYVWSRSERAVRPTPVGTPLPLPSALSSECRDLLESFDVSGIYYPADWVRLAFQACPELAFSEECRDAREALEFAAVQDRMRILSGFCWFPFCPDAVSALDDAEVGRSERAPLLRARCEPIVGSDLLSDEELAGMLDESPLDSLPPDSDAYWDALGRLNERFGAWFLAEMLYSRSSALPEPERQLVRNVFRTSLLFTEVE